MAPPIPSDYEPPFAQTLRPSMAPQYAPALKFSETQNPDQSTTGRAPHIPPLRNMGSPQPPHTKPFANKSRPNSISKPILKAHHTQPSPYSQAPLPTTKHPPPKASSSKAPILNNKPLTLPREILFISAICLAQTISLAGLAQTVAPLPIIGADFGEHNPAALSWLPAAFSLTAGTFILPAGRLGDMYGLKRLYVVGFVWYAVFSLVAGMSVYVNFVMFAVMRAFQGIGPAILVPNALALVGKSYNTPELHARKHLVLGLFAASAPIGFLLGALFSSLFAQLGWWPWGFWCQSIVCFVGAGFVYVVVPTDQVPRPDVVGALKEMPEMMNVEVVKDTVEAVKDKVGLGVDKEREEKSSGDTDVEKEGDGSSTTVTTPSLSSSISASSTNHKDSTPHEQPKKRPTYFDTPGALTGVTSLILLNFAFNYAPLRTWSHPAVLSTLVLSLLLLGTFIYTQTHQSAASPLIPKGMQLKAILALLCVSAGWASFGIWMFYWWQLQEVLRGYTPLEAVTQNCVVIPSGLLASLTTSHLLGKMPTSCILLASMLAFTLGMTLLATVPLHQTFWAQTFVSLLVMPWGMDMSFPSTIAIVSEALPAEHQGTASSLVNTVVNFSISMGLGVTGTIIKHTGGTEDVSGAGQVGPSGQSGLYPGGDVKRTHTLLKGFRAAWFFGIGLDVLGVLIATGFVLSEVLATRRKARRTRAEA